MLLSCPWGYFCRHLSSETLKTRARRHLESILVDTYRAKRSKHTSHEALGSHFCRHLSIETLENTPQEGSPKYPTARIKKNMPIYKRVALKTRVKIDPIKNENPRPQALLSSGESLGRYFCRHLSSETLKNTPQEAPGGPNLAEETTGCQNPDQEAAGYPEPAQEA